MDKAKNKYILLIISAIAIMIIVADLFIGGIDIEIFAYPLNLILLAIWILGVASLWSRRKDSSFAKFMLSSYATWLSLGVMVVIGICIGTKAESATTSLGVISSILFILTHLSLVVVRGWRNIDGIRWRFIATHVGLLLALVAGFWGAPDRSVQRMALGEGEKSSIAYTMAGGAVSLDYEIELRELNTARDSRGRLSSIEAEVIVNNAEAELSVNKPYTKDLSTRIYIYDVKQGSERELAVIEIISEPWQHISVVGILLLMAGAVMMFAKGPKQIKR